MRRAVAARVALAAALACFAILPHAVEAASAGTSAGGAGTGPNPIRRTVQLITELQAKVIADGEKEKETYGEYVAWCRRSSQEKKFEIKHGTTALESLEATITKAESDADEASAQIQELSGSTATNEADLKAVTLLRTKEKADFEALDAELRGTIETLVRARRVLEKELAKRRAGGEGSAGSFLQRPSEGLRLFAATLGRLVDAATVFSPGDRARLSVLVQAGGAASPDDLGAPAADVYTPRSSGILEALHEMQEKAEASQVEARKKEQDARRNFELLKQSLEGKIATESTELEQSRQDLAEAREQRAKAVGGVERTRTELRADQESITRLQRDCMDRATQFEAETRTRGEELKALAAAKAAIQDTIGGGAESRAYSFAQVSETNIQASGSRRAGAAVSVLRRLRALGARIQSAALAQLVSRCATAIRYSTGTRGLDAADPFAKVRGLIEDMIGRLQREAEQQAAKKAFCDREMAHTNSSKDEQEGRVESAATRLEQITAQVAGLKEDLSTLAKEISEIQHSQSDVDKLRREEHAENVKARSDFEEGLRGVQTALKILRDYYAEDKSEKAAFVEAEVGDAMHAAGQGRGPSGAGAGVIGMLEVVESDLAKSLAEVQENEDEGQAAYERVSQENKIAEAQKREETKHKKGEVAALEKTASEVAADKASSQQELDAINEYLEQLKSKCIAKPEGFEERLQRREAEMEGLRQALGALEAASEPDRPAAAEPP